MANSSNHYTPNKASYWMQNEDQYNQQEEGEVSPPGDSYYPPRADRKPDSHGARDWDRGKEYDHSEGKGMREWDRGKEYERSRDRSRRSSSSRSRSAERRRRRDQKKRDRSHDSSESNEVRQSARRRSRSRSKDRSYNSRRDRDWPSTSYEQHDQREREHERADSWRSVAPNSTIMVSSLPLHVTENEIRASIVVHGLVPKDIRLIRRKDTGTSRGFAFVEFNQLPDAVRWMEINQGYLVLENQFQATMQYSISKDSFNDKIANKVAQTDWFCVNCGEHNFKRREVCFKCQSPRGESELVDDVQREISMYPTNTVLLRNLDTLTTEDSVLGILQTIPGVATLPIKSVRIGRDPLNNISRGICYLDMNNNSDAMRLFSGLSSLQGLYIDGREAMISYCKVANSNATAAIVATTTPKASTPAGITAVAAAQWSVSNTAHMPPSTASGSNQESNFSKEDIPGMAEYSASMYAKTAEEHASYLQYYTQYYTNQLESRRPKVEKAPAVSATAPDLSKYVFDEKSGYYYDVTANLYYDAKTQYFYDPTTQLFSYWDNDQNAFIPATNTGDGQTGASATGPGDKVDDKSKEKPEKQDKVTVAKKIAKDMEKWAKTLNQRKESTKVATPAPEFETVERRSAAKEVEPVPATPVDNTLDEVLQVLQRKQLAEKTLMMNKKKKPLGASALVSYGSDNSDNEQKPHPDDKKRLALELEQMVDFTKLACLLCKRQFANRETLAKHQQLSDLHKQNVETWKKERAATAASAASSNRDSYRDRAKERRQKFGEPEPPRGGHQQRDHHHRKDARSRSSHREPSPSSSRHRSPEQNSLAGGSNVGSKLLQKMGWQEGQGLGKSNQGRTEIITADRRTAQAGLGMKTYAVVTDDYRQSVRNLAMMRFKELNDQP